MAITNFIPKLWSSAVQLPFVKNLIYTQTSVANHEYEGQIRQMGDTVNITTIGDPTINTYDKTVD
nr:coat protein [Actinomycetota bacterium]